MGFLDKIMPSRRHAGERGGNYSTITEMSPAFSPWDGDLYSQETVRASIERFASACSKLKPRMEGSSHPAIRRAIETTPNQYGTWAQLFERAATLLEVDTTAYIVPQFASDMQTITGFWNLKPTSAEVREFAGEPWFVFGTANGDMAIEMRNVVVLTKFQYMSDIFGSPNCIDATMQILHTQDEAMRNAVMDGAKIRFIGRVNGQMREEDIEKKRDRFVESNLTVANKSGLMIYDTTFNDIQQVKPYSYTIDPDEMARTEKNVLNYFGTNEKILQNKFDEKTWNAWYEGKVAPFAVKVAEGLTHVCFTQRERANGNRITVEDTRLEYSPMSARVDYACNLFDRNLITKNEARRAVGLEPVEGGDVFWIRGEYKAPDEGAGETAQEGGDDAGQRW